MHLRRSITGQYANDECRRQTEKSPFAQIELSLSTISVGEYWADAGDYDEPDGDRPDERIARSDVRQDGALIGQPAALRRPAPHAGANACMRPGHLMWPAH